MVTKTFIVPAMTGWTEKEMMNSLSEDFYKLEYISGYDTEKGKVKITVSIERVVK